MGLSTAENMNWWLTGFPHAVKGDSTFVVLDVENGEKFDTMQVGRRVFVTREHLGLIFDAYILCLKFCRYCQRH